VKGNIFYEGKEFYFANLRSLTVQAGGKTWVYDKHTETELKFTPAPLGYAGAGNYLKQWRKRWKRTQTGAAEILGVSQSFIAKIEKGERNLPLEMFEKIRQDIRKYGRNTPWAE
jgi:DNA-binding XRE family transcriptional regulator